MSSLDSELGELQARYKQLSPTGWILLEECDSLLFTALLAVGKGEALPELFLAEKSPGQWLRKPDGNGECSSDISRDMLMGVLTYAVFNRDASILERLISYADSHRWKMGEERSTNPKRAGRTYLVPGLYGLLHELSRALGGKHSSLWAMFPQILQSSNPGFESHLSMLAMACRGKTRGKLNWSEKWTLRSIIKKCPRNALAAALSYRYDNGSLGAVRELVKQWPQDRLPNKGDWTEDWRTQRADDDSGLVGSESNKPHSGGDLLFVLRVTLDNL